MTLDEFVRLAVAVPYEDRGRSWSGWDCWGLVYLAYRDCLGIDLPSWSDAYATAADRAECARLIEGGKADWTEIPLDAARDLDALLLRDGRTASHVGLLIGGRLLHAREGAGTTYEPLDRWRPRIVGCYRYQR